MANASDVKNYTVKLALATKVDDHIEIAIEADDGTKLKLTATAEKLDALIGDLETITASSTAGEVA